MRRSLQGEGPREGAELFDEPKCREISEDLDDEFGGILKEAKAVESPLGKWVLLVTDNWDRQSVLIDEGDLRAFQQHCRWKLKDLGLDREPIPVRRGVVDPQRQGPPWRVK